MKAAIWCIGTLCISISLFAQATQPKTKRPAAHAVSASEVQALRDALAAQQLQMAQQHEEMEQLKSQLQQLLQSNAQSMASVQQVQTSTEQAQSVATRAQESATTAQEMAAKASSQASDTRSALAVVETKDKEEDKKLMALETLAGRFRFTGDVRVRGENFMQDASGFSDRNRARVRVRFGLDGKISDDFTGGVLLTSGSLGDSNSTNETLTNFFTRKSIGIDRAYVTYHPAALKWMSLTGGKFAYTWQRTSATFDPDLNPEGFAEKFSFDFKTPVIKNFAVQGLQLLYNENNDLKFVNGNDSYAVGGQVSGRIELGPLTTTPSFTILNWRNPDAILNAPAFAVQATTTGTPAGATTPVTGLPVPGEGPGCAKGSGLPATPPCVYGPQGFTNATVVDDSGKVHFLSGFLYADFILNNQIKTGWKRFPVNLLLEYQNNLNAADHPLDSTGAATDLNKQSHAYLVDVSLGQSKARNDLQFGYAWVRAEQDSAIASFIESENRAPTNLLQNRIYVLWRIRSNTVASYNLWIGRTLNSNLQHAVLAPGTVPGTTEPWLQRHQFDLVYTF